MRNSINTNGQGFIGVPTGQTAVDMVCAAPAALSKLRLILRAWCERGFTASVQPTGPGLAGSNHEFVQRLADPTYLSLVAVGDSLSLGDRRAGRIGLHTG